MRLVPFFSLAIGLFFVVIGWRRRARFGSKPYHHWFIFLHLAAVGQHQFEEYGWPGGFASFFIAMFGLDAASPLVPSVAALELLNAFVLTSMFGLLGWLGTRFVWVGLAVLFINFANGLFHLIYSVTHWVYVPGLLTRASPR